MMKRYTATIALYAQWLLAVTILIFSTIAFGGYLAETISIVRFLILFGFLIQVVLLFSQDDYLSDFHPAVFVPSLIFIAFLVLVFLQYFFGLKILHKFPLGSLNVYMTYDSWIQMVIYFIFFISCLKIAADRQQVERLSSLIIVLTFVVATLGMAQKMAAEKILWRSLSLEEGAFFGPFINENHFGGFLALTFPLALALLHYRFNQAKQKNLAGKKGSSWLTYVNEGVVFLFLLVVVTLAACFFSAARVSTFVLLFCCAGYFVVHAIKERNIGFYLVLLLILVCSFLLVQGVMAAGPVDYFDPEKLKNAWNIRFQVSLQSLSLLRDYFWFGTGLGTYGLVSSKAVSYMVNQVWWQHAHNDFIELLTDTGAVGFGLLIGAFAILVFSCFKQTKKITSGWNRAIATQSLISIFCIGAMEFSDFHLKMPSITFLFIFQLALLLQASFPREQRLVPVSPILKTAVLLIGIGLAVPITLASMRQYQASKLTRTIEGDRLTNLQTAAELVPSDPRLWYLLGRESWTHAQGLEQLERREEAAKLEEKAVIAMRKAVALAPSWANVWFDLGTLEYQIALPGPAIHSLEKAVYWSPNRWRNSLYLLSIYFAESQKMGSLGKLEEKEELLRRAKVLYDQVQVLDPKPAESDYLVWMGQYYDKKLQAIRG